MVYVEGGTPTNSCKYPYNPNNVYNYTISGTSDHDDYLDCSGNKNDIPEIDYCEITEDMTIEQLITRRRTILVTIQNLQTLYSGTDLMYWTKIYLECLYKIDDLAASKFFDSNSLDPMANKEAAIEYFDSIDDFLHKTTAYGIMVQSGEYDRASAYLNTLSTESEEESNFKWVQQLNLAYLKNKFSFELAEVDKQTLYSIGKTDQPLNGYARSLYEILTDERIEVVFAEPLDEMEVEGRSGETSLVDFSIKSYPNPVLEGNYQVEIAGLENGMSLSASLYDANGREIVFLTWSRDGIFSIDLEGIVSGVYFLKVSNSDRDIVYQTKFVVVK